MLTYALAVLAACASALGTRQLSLVEPVLVLELPVALGMFLTQSALNAGSEPA